MTLQPLDPNNPRISISQFNRMVATINALLRKLPAEGLIGSDIGFVTRPMPRPYRERVQTIKIKNTGSTDIPMYSFCELYDYDYTKGIYAARKPTIGNLNFNRLAITRDVIDADGGMGTAYCGGEHWLRVSSTDGFTFGTQVSCIEDDYRAQADSNGPYIVLTVDSGANAIYVRDVGGASTGYTLAKITQTITRGDPTTYDSDEPQPAVLQYKAKILGGPETPEWSPDNVYYAEGTVIQYDGKFYECTSNHYSSDTKVPGESGLWEETVEGVDVHLDGVGFYQNDDGSLFQYTHCYMPWYPLNSVVRVYQRQMYDSSQDAFTGDMLWFIEGPHTRIEYYDGQEYKFSIRWHETEGRAMAVFG